MTLLSLLLLDSIQQEEIFFVIESNQKANEVEFSMEQLIG